MKTKKYSLKPEKKNTNKTYLDSKIRKERVSRYDIVQNTHISPQVGQEVRRNTNKRAKKRNNNNKNNEFKLKKITRVYSIYLNYY